MAPKKKTTSSKGKRTAGARTPRTTSRGRARGAATKKAPAKKKAARKAKPKTPAWHEPFLEELERSRSVSKAAKRVGVGRRTAYDWKERDADFRDSWDELMGPQLQDDLRASIWEQVTEGVKVTEIQTWTDDDGVERKRTKIQRRQSETLAAMMAKAHLPEYAHLAGGSGGEHDAQAAEVLAEKIRGFISAGGGVPTEPPREGE